jgi:hypothetical protein
MSQTEPDNHKTKMSKRWIKCADIWLKSGENNWEWRKSNKKKARNKNNRMGKKLYKKKNNEQISLWFV